MPWIQARQARKYNGLRKVAEGEAVRKPIKPSKEEQRELALASSLITKHIGLEPYEEQLHAAIELTRGSIVNQNTGEGKTISILIAAIILANRGHKVFIVTSNDYLSKRDYQYSRPIFNELGRMSLFFSEGIGGTDDLYDTADVIYATGETLIFDYLRGIKAEYDFAIIDEVDYILVESAGHDFSVSDGKNLISLPYDVFEMCKSLAEYFSFAEKTESVPKEDVLFDYNYEYDYVIDRVSRSVSITERGYRKLESMYGPAEDNMMLIEAMLATLTVKHFYIRDSEYIVSGGKIEIIDASSGRVMPGGSNGEMIQTAIEVKEQVPLTGKALLSNTCSFTVFFTVFEKFAGISGTSSYVPYDFDTIYGKETVSIKDHFPNQRQEYYEYLKDDEERIERILELIEGDGPFLLVGDSDARTKKLINAIERKTNKHVFTLENENIEQETEILESIKSKDAVLISSKIVGRGTDIVLPESYENGLTVILTIRYLSERAEKQIIGRTGRNGKKGLAYILTSLDDVVFGLRSGLDRQVDEELVKRFQADYEQKAFAVRKHIYIRSKLFFDIDRAITERLESFTSFEEILDFVKGHDSRRCSDCKKAVEVKIRLGCSYSMYHKSIVMETYRKLKPIYQAQFISFNDSMASSLYDINGFYERSKEYLEQGIDMIAWTISVALAPGPLHGGKRLAGSDLEVK